MVSCHDCGGKCCVGIIEVLPSDVLYQDESLTIAVAEHHRFRVMRMDMSGRCAALSGGLCSVYEHRPWVCRKFELGGECCLSFRDEKKKIHECKKCLLFEIEKKND